MDVTLTARYEYKYLVPEVQAEALWRDLGLVTEPDPFAAGRPGAAYPIHTLYLDTPGLDCYRATAEGHKTRFKLRIRLYEDDPDAPAFAEIKRRLDQWILKRRARVTRSAAAAAAQGRVALPGAAGRSAADFAEFRDLVSRFAARPVVWVGYVRQPRVAPARQPVRISLDTELSWAVPRPGLTPPLASDWQPVPLGARILEIKFTGLFPAWTAAIVRAHELERVSVCKYALAVEEAEARGLLPWISSRTAC